MDFTEAYDDTSTSVGLAARMGNAAILQELLQNGSPTNGHDNRGWRPLHEAAMGGHVECVRLLLTAEDAEVDALSHDRTTALLLSCLSASAHAAVVKLLLTAGADPNMTEGDDWILPLPTAALNKNVDIVKLLLDAGADPNKADFNNGSPMHVAAKKCSMEMAKLLIEKGAEVDLKDESGHTPLHVLLFQSVVETALLPFMNLLIEKGCDINASMIDGTTPLMLAVQSNKTEAVSKLLECGADPNVAKAEGVMAIHFAIEFCPDADESADYRELSDEEEEGIKEREDTENEEEPSHILKMILDLTDRSLIIPKPLKTIKYSIFHLAVEWQRFNALKLLISCGLPPDSFLQDSANAALDEEDVNLFRQVPLVVDIGTEVDTPLGFLLSKAFSPENIEIAKFMIDKGSNVNAARERCLPPLVATVKHQRASFDKSCPGQDILHYLLNHGADILHKIRKTDVLPAALHISSLFNVSAFFTLLLWGVPAHEVYTRHTLEELSLLYSSSKFYNIYPLFPWRVISVLHVLNLFIPQLPLDTKVMFDSGRMVDDDSLTAAWNNIEAVIETPKDLQSLCVLAVRKAVSGSQGWNDLSSSLMKLCFSNAPLPPLIMDRLLFKQIQRASLYCTPPQSAMPSYSQPLSLSHDSSGESVSNFSEGSSNHSGSLYGDENDGDDEPIIDEGGAGPSGLGGNNSDSMEGIIEDKICDSDKKSLDVCGMDVEDSADDKSSQPDGHIVGKRKLSEPGE